MLIKWEGKNTQGNIKWTAEGSSYKELYENIQDKYGHDYIIDSNAYEIAMLEKNREDLDKYDVTTDGIGNWELYESFECRNDLQQLDESDYRSIINCSDGNAYHQTFEEFENETH